MPGSEVMCKPLHTLEGLAVSATVVTVQWRVCLEQGVVGSTMLGTAVECISPSGKLRSMAMLWGLLELQGSAD